MNIGTVAPLQYKDDYIHLVFNRESPYAFSCILLFTGIHMVKQFSKSVQNQLKFVLSLGV